MAWVPMGMSPEQHAELVDGIQPWMREDMKGWLARAISMNTTSGPTVDHDLIREFDRRARSADPIAEYLQRGGGSAFEYHLYNDSALYIRFVDFLVWKRSQEPQSERSAGILALLNAILEAGGSRWKVGDRRGVPGLELRVPEGVQQAAETAMSTPGHAGTLLSEAWHAVFGVNPMPETGYRQAVLAVEAAAIPVVIPTDPSATLGKVFTVMRDQKDWALDIKKQHKDYPTTAVLLSMIQMLWAGQGRHAGQPDWAPNTQAEAEVAVMLAVPLVQWFSSGAIARRP
ncbi:hypothetical protein [Microbacterium sp. SSM24]|uniref:hypothetical protein n=1 Tax=Microbacterium sp. SSM24 TaxID=2991714 RepID=UPI0022270759|nr:hypothetical protein [Microbacterium sp. SSM24]MCW3494173.1 hypothetical protein [Microbacterium sp. SSM24]